MGGDKRAWEYTRMRRTMKDLVEQCKLAWEYVRRVVSFYRVAVASSFSTIFISISAPPSLHLLLCRVILLYSNTIYGGTATTC